MKAVNPIPSGYHTVTPYLPVRGCKALIAFMTKGLGAEVTSKSETPDGTVMNAEVKIGTSMVMVAEARPDYKPSSTMLYLYVPDVDAFYRAALAGGGKSVLEPMDQFYGDRSGAVEDPCANQWWIASRKEDLTAEEIARRAEAAGKR